ncbi:nitroreductase/quinone reductase family protein [Streptomyces sp. NPDC051940]|uniref:nitroreductase/quinone reductase family protein n=1 Tax=Streptomyces sp. NPDC051940 TaxID=3155675 RepID=UPI00343BB5F9
MQPDNDQINRLVADYRANSGRLGGPYENRRVILLTTADGARTTPVVHYPDHREGAPPRMLVVATDAPQGPSGWYGDLLARAEAEVEAGVFTFPVKAEFLAGEERDRLFARIAEADPAVAGVAAGELLPVVALTPVGGGPPSGPMGESLKAIHQGMRQELALIRAELAAAAEGSAPGLILQLRVNCLTFCQGLEFHHTGEDNGVFPGLERAHPELAGTIARLRREHEVVHDILVRLRETVALDGAAPVPPGEVLAEVDRLIGELEAHLDYEEEQLVEALNQIVL